MVFYAVAVGHTPGVYDTWNECKANTHGFSGARYKKFKTLVDALKFIADTRLTFESTSPVKTSGVQKKQSNKCALSNCASSKEYLQSKVEESPQGCRYYKKFSTPLGMKSENVQIKREPLDFGDDYIPLQQMSTISIKKEKQEPFDPDTSAFFEDKEGDDELMLAMAALQEYPDEKPQKALPPPPPKPKQPINKAIKIGPYNFTVNEDGYVKVYIAGHYENIGAWNCSSGYGVYYGLGHPLNVTDSCVGKISHYAADLEAAICAINTAIDIKICKLCIYTSSEFLLKAVTIWIHAWKKRAWRNQNGKVVANRKEFVKLDQLLSNENIFVKWCDAKEYKDNTSVKAMREAKELARHGCEEYMELHPRKESKDFSGEEYFEFFF